MTPVITDVNKSMACTIILLHLPRSQFKPEQHRYLSSQTIPEINIILHRHPYWVPDSDS